MTDGELAVLGLIVEAPRHGYEIEQVIQERGMREWTGIGFSSIYYILTKLTSAGLLEAAEGRSHGGPARKVYRPTAAGVAACRAATLKALVTGSGERPFLLGLSNVAMLPPHQAEAAVREYADRIETQLGEVRVKRGAVEEGSPWFVDAIFDYSVATMSAELAWVRGLSERMNEMEGQVDPMPRKMKPLVPEIVEAPSRTMAVARTTGDPTEVGAKVFPALYGAVYPLKSALKNQGVEYKIEPPRARWFGGPDWATLPRDQWEAAWAIPVPDGTTDLVQKDPEIPVTVETWDYGTVAEVLFIGAYADEESTIRQLHGFIDDQGYEIAGAHEEEYQSRPDAKAPKTVIRYQVRRKS